MAGCCVHIATVVFYLSYAQHRIANDPRNIKLPAKHLDSIVVNTKTLEKPNAPRYVRNKRRNNLFIEKETEFASSTSESSDLSSDENDERLKIKPNNHMIKIKEKHPEDQSNFTNDKMEYEKHPPPKIQFKNSKQNTKIPRVLKSSAAESTVEEIIPTFVEHIPSLGGSFIKKNGQKILMTNTCTFDNYLFSMWVLSKLVPNFFFIFRFKN